MSDFTVGDAKEFETDGGYTFPFDLFDKTPGGGNLGRIEWMIEPIFETYEDGSANCIKILVSARQTRDPRYKAKVFELECRTPRICSYDDDIAGKGTRNFFKAVWSIGKCAEHGATTLTCYPPDGCSRLVFGDGLYSEVLLNVWWAP